VEHPPAVLDGIDREFVSGIGRHEGKIIILLTMDKVLDASSPDRRREVHPMGKKKILIVEDEESLLKLESILLSSRGYEVVELSMARRP